MKKLQYPQPSSKDIIRQADEYINNVRPQRNVNLANDAKTFNGLKTNREKAEMLMDKKYHWGHWWYLYVFHNQNGKALNDTINELEKDKPWEAAMNGQFKDFEELHSHISQLVKKPGINNMVVYDLSTCIAYYVNHQLLPKDYVYIHSSQKEKAKAIMATINPKLDIKGKDFRIPYSSLGQFANGLTADEWEDLFCIFYFDNKVCVPSKTTLKVCAPKN